MVGAACGESRSTVSGEVVLDPRVNPSMYRNLEIRAVPYDPDAPDARTKPEEPPVFAESVPLADVDFPYAFAMEAPAFHGWRKGWAVAWLTPHDDAQWVLTREPFGAIRIELVEPAARLAPQTSDADVRIDAPDQ